MVKTEVHQQCLLVLEDKINRCVDLMNDAQESANNDTKSSAGDKHETSRAMAMLEKEKLANQLGELDKMREVLTKIDAQSSSSAIGVGSLVFTNVGVFYLSIALGKILVDDAMLFCISKASPMGEKLAGKSSGDSFELNAKTITVEKVL